MSESSRMLRASSGVLRHALLSALGLLPLGCGGVSTSSGLDGDAANGGAATGGVAMSGGVAAGGESTADAASGGEPTGGGSVTGGEAAGGGSVTGGEAAGGGSVTGGEAAGGSGLMLTCAGSIPDGAGNTGYERCANNHVLHRVAIVQCPSSGPGPYTCKSDQDCPEAGICVCAGGRSYCAPATCRVDADCGSGLLCRGYDTSQCGLQMDEKFACQTPEDTCAGPGDCEAGARCGGDSGRFRCDVPASNPACGAPPS